MLVLSRALGEMISIGDTITVRVLEVKDNSVRFGIEAPTEVNVHRTEVYYKIRRRQVQGPPCVSD